MQILIFYLKFYSLIPFLFRFLLGLYSHFLTLLFYYKSTPKFMQDILFINSGLIAILVQSLIFITLVTIGLRLVYIYQFGSSKPLNKRFLFLVIRQICDLV